MSKEKGLLVIASIVSRRDKIPLSDSSLYVSMSILNKELVEHHFLLLVHRNAC